MAYREKGIPIPIKADLAKLPRRARVAYAARCARRVQRLYTVSWPDAPEESVQFLEKSITQSEQAAIRVDYAPIAVRSIGDALLAAINQDFAGYKEFRDFGKSVIYTAACAAEAAMEARPHANADDSVAEKAANAAGHAIEAVCHALRDSNTDFDGVAMIGQDFDLLRMAARQDQWTDDTPVPPEFFGPMWPEGAPEGWPVQEEGSADHRLLIELEVPDGVSDEEVIARAKELSDMADDLHRAYGGSGLKVEEIEIYDDAVVREGVPA